VRMCTGRFRFSGALGHTDFAPFGILARLLTKKDRKSASRNYYITLVPTSHYKSPRFSDLSPLFPTLVSSTPLRSLFHYVLIVSIHSRYSDNL
jgi:hypothetical protein